MDTHDREELDRFIEEHLKQVELCKAALATNDEAVIAARLKEILDWNQKSPYSHDNFKLVEKADELAKELYGKPFSEMSMDEFDEPVCGDDK